MSLKERLKKMREKAEKPIDSRSRRKYLVAMPDGSFKEYAIYDRLVTGRECVCNKNSKVYHTHFRCPYLNKSDVIIYMKNYDAMAQHMEYCEECKCLDDEDVIE